MTELFQHGKIDNQIANRDAHARFALSWLKNAEGKILQMGKCEFGWDFDESTQRRAHQLDLATKHTKRHEENSESPPKNFVLFR